MAKRSYKLAMEDGSEQIIRTEMSMFELGNELRSKAKISTENLTGSTVKPHTTKVACFLVPSQA